MRTVFMRHLKLGPRGGKRKNPYYLNDMMQFVIPFLKPVALDISGNVHSPASIEKQNTDVMKRLCLSCIYVPQVSIHIDV
jgi:hypothetical protein